SGLSFFDILNTSLRWQILFSYRFPGLYTEIKKLKNVDHTLRTPRYSSIWETWYSNFLEINQYYDVNIIEDINLNFLNTPTPKLISMSPETVNILYCLKLWNEHPMLYTLSLEYLPDTLITKKILYNEMMYYRTNQHIYLETSLSLKEFIEEKFNDKDYLINSFNPGNVLIVLNFTISFNYIFYKNREKLTSLLDMGYYIYSVKYIYDKMWSDYNYEEKSYYYMLFKRIFKEAAEGDLKELVRLVPDLGELITEVRPELEFAKPVNRQLFFE
ncbi:MAG TPA: hypothetical protein VKR58_00330, partial [Aquella sp.]|nr:hypothetical protein [Aquella sp.]